MKANLRYRVLLLTRFISSYFVYGNWYSLLCAKKYWRFQTPVKGNMDIARASEWHSVVLQVLFIATLIMSAGCNKANRQDCITAAGETITITRTLPFSFTKVIIDRKVDVVLVQDTVNYAIITAPENLIDNIVTQQKEESVLRISNDNKCNWVRRFDNKFSVILHFKKLQQIYYTGIGDVTCVNNITGDSLRLDIYSGAGTLRLKADTYSAWWNIHTGTTDVHMEGKVGVSYIYDAATGPVDARNLITGYTFCTNKGTNNLYVNVEKELGATVTYTGNIYYTGKPYKVITTTLNTGKVIKF